MKSLAMNKLFSKSHEDLPKINSSIEMLLTEQRHQRGDLQVIKTLVTGLVTDFALLKQVQDFYEEPESEGTLNKDDER